MTIKNSLYFRNVTRRWKKEADESEQILFLSPYITSNTAETVLLQNTDTRCSVYTCFDAENFVYKASSLKTLKKLLQTGCELFHVEDLHAKVMLTDDFISVGSQNLTNRGSANKEATFCSNDASYIKYGREAVSAWIDDAEEITLEMIEDMEELIAPHIKEFEELKRSLEEIESILADKSEQRKNKALQERQTAMRRNVKTVKKSSRFIYASVECLTNYGEWNDTYTFSLVPDTEHVSFCHWDIGGDEIILTTQKRYLLMDTETARIGWARVGKTRITYICDNVTRKDSVLLGNRTVEIGFNANWSLTKAEHNLTVTLNYRHSGIKLVYRCFFDLEFISDIRIDEATSSEGCTDSDEYKWNSSHKDEFEKCIAQQLLSPFIYQRRLVGEQANEFFKDSKSYWKRVSLGELRGHSILICEPET